MFLRSLSLSLFHQSSRSSNIATLGVTFVVTMLAFFVPQTALAAGKTPQSLAVLPFTGKGIDGDGIKEAVELELELVETVTVVSSKDVEADIKKNGKQAFDEGKLSKSLKNRSIGVLIKGERTKSAKGKKDILLVTTYAQDGKRRSADEFALPEGDVEETAQEIVRTLTPLFKKWSSLKPIAGSDGKDSKDGKKTKDEDLFVDDLLGDDDDDTKNGKDNKNNKNNKNTKKNDDDNKDNKDDNKDDKKDVRDIFADDDDKKEDKDNKKDDDNRMKMGDIVDDKNKPLPGLLPVFSAGVFFDGQMWNYNFDADEAAESYATGANLYPGGSLRLEWWPVRWLGFDAEGGAARVPFRVKPDSRIQILPSEFAALQYGGAASLRLRYVVENPTWAIGIAGRVGYRYWASSVETQIHAEDGKNLTVVPGYELQALSIGAEVAPTFLVGGRPVRLALIVDGMPVTQYAESPDNPGGAVTAYAISGSLTGRLDVSGGFFLEAGARGIGVFSFFDGTGDRLWVLRDENGDRLPLSGGSVSNNSLGFTAGLGWQF